MNFNQYSQHSYGYIDVNPSDVTERQEIIHNFYDLLDSKLTRIQRVYRVYSVFYYLLNLLIFLIGFTISLLVYLAQYGQMSLEDASLINGILGIAITFIEGILSNTDLESKRDSLIWQKDYLLNLREKLSLQLLVLKPKKDLLDEIERYLANLERFSTKSMLKVVENKVSKSGSSQLFIQESHNQAPGHGRGAEMVSSQERTLLWEQTRNWLNWRLKVSKLGYWYYTVLYYFVIILVYLCGLAIAVLGFLVRGNQIDDIELVNFLIGLLSLIASAGNGLVNWCALDSRRQNFLLQRTYCELIDGKLVVDKYRNLPFEQYKKVVMNYYSKLAKVTKYRPPTLFLDTKWNRIYY